MLEQVRRGLAAGARRPVRTARVLGKRLFPVGPLVRDPEVYQAVANWTFGRTRRVPLTQLFPGIAEVDVRVPRAFDRDPNASMSATEVLSVGAIVSLLQPRRILEVGTYQGNTTLALAANAPEGARVTTLDLPPDAHDMSLDVPETMRNPTAPAEVGRQFRDAALPASIEQVFGDSATHDWGTLPGPFDLVVIDGCHFESYVRSDSENAMGVLAPGGIIVWHDYGVIEDVARVVDSLAARLDIAVVLGTSLAIGRIR